MYIGQLTTTARRNDILECKGQILDKATYGDLFDVIGHKFKRYTWKQSAATLSSTAIWRDSTWIDTGGGNKRIFVVGGGKATYTDDYGETWSTVYTVSGTGESVIASNGSNLLVFAELDSTKFYYSTTGLSGSWTASTTTMTSSQTWSNALYTGTNFVIVANEGANNRAWRSSDGDTWTAATFAPFNNGGANTIYFNSMALLSNGSLVAVMSRGAIQRSDDDGETWQFIGRLPVTFKENELTYTLGVTGNDNLVAFSQAGYHMYISADGGYTWNTKHFYQEDDYFTYRTTSFNDMIVNAPDAGADADTYEYTQDGIHWDKFTILPYTCYVSGVDDKIFALRRNSNVTAYGELPFDSGTHFMMPAYSERLYMKVV